MSTTQPIRDKQDLSNFMNYYRDVQPHERNYALIILGLHTALRISDILQLTWGTVYDFEENKYRCHLLVTEKKTKKENKVALSRQVTHALENYAKIRRPAAEDYIFSKTTDCKTPLCRSQAFRIIKKAACTSIHSANISCHSLRKTFGYYAWKQGTQPALLMDIYNHSSYSVTKKYLGIDQDERDSIFMEIDFLK